MDRDDLRAAVAAGIVSEAQAAQLAALSDSRRGAREAIRPGDEPFELFKGFNEIFIVVGLVILAVGWVGISTAAATQEIVNLPMFTATRAAIGAAILWVLAEYFIWRRRMVAPAIALSLMWAANAGVGLTAWQAQPFMIAQNDFSSVPFPLALATLAIFAFWLRFRVPIALAMVALGIFAVAVVWSAVGGERPESLTDLFLLSAEGNFAWITLVVGVATFAVAMAFDMSDPHRVTRRSANGFWLHVVAAPAIVNTVALTLLGSDSYLGLGLFLSLIALVAIIIDRRSFLVAGVGYVVAMATTLAGADGAAQTILILGVVMVFTGAFWERIRSLLLGLLGPVIPRDRLPPAA